MKKIILASLLFSAASLQANELFLDYALKVKQEIFTNLEKCGLDIRNVQTDYLRVPADRLIFSPDGVLLARYRQFGLIGGNQFEWKNPNGGFNHSMRQGYDRIKFVTPYAGTVAIVNQFTTVGGRGFNYLCRSRYVNYGVWDQCVRANFINVVSGKLCRFGKPVTDKNASDK